MTDTDPEPQLLPVSLVIPNFNAAPYLAQCLLSVTASGRQPSEILLIDNASTDSSVAVAAGLGIPQLKIVRNEINLGASRARSIGVDMAREELVCFLDSDDFLGPDAIGLAYTALVEEGLDYSVFDLFRVDEDGTGERPETEPPRTVIGGHRAFALTLGRWRIFSMGVLAKNLYLRALSRFEHHGYADDELLVRHTFLEADRVGGSSGRYFYRDVPKPYSTDRVLGQVRANVAALELASRHREKLAGDEALRHMRNVATRNLLGLAVRFRRERRDLGEVRALQTRYRLADVPWGPGDTRFRLMAAALAVLTIGRH